MASSSPCSTLPHHSLLRRSLHLPGGKVKLSGSIGSQYLTALLMASPLALVDVEIEIIDKLISIPYVDMILKLMERFGVSVQHADSWDSNGLKKFVCPYYCSYSGYQVLLEFQFVQVFVAGIQAPSMGRKTTVEPATITEVPYEEWIFK
ncbi:hypothetical protein L2E82_23134 [Cichorium intybus]|uniref:Uncharacterized protein n=1 Tax=Cichorium intybus TaxID=13427 RepID=A0ACB9DZN8_CICIN|nr:hypothetical protein L2E82_23134 [Cichorium intybus]